ncbi:MAG: ABC transporter ATP-binding protein/permease [Syntrophobacterales bacterium]|nr:ABC transporter ATP-binding protein/permease [Syntrophobacterales bacterium]
MEAGKDITRIPLFYWILTRYRLHQITALILVIVTIFLRVFPLEMQKKIVNLAIAMKSVYSLFTYCALYIVAIISAGLLKYVVNIITNFVGQKIVYEIRTALFNHVLRLPLSFFRKTPPGMTISFIINELGSIGEFLGEAISTPLVNILSLFAFAGFMFYLNPLLALVSLCVYPFQVAIVPILQNKFNRLNQERMEITRNASNFLGEVISGVHEIHCNASYELEGQRFEKFSYSLFKIRYRMAAVKFLIKWMNNFFQNLGPFILFLLGGYLSIQGRLDIGALIAFLSAYEKLSDPWKELIEYYQNYQDARVRYKKVMETFSYDTNVKLVPTDRQVYTLSGNLEMDRVSFTVDHSIKIVDSVSCKINSKERVAIVGFSGSGKSTLIMILAQLCDYTGGHVLIDEKELRELTKADVSLNLGYVAQSPFIFSGTILENILYGCNAAKTIGEKISYDSSLKACEILPTHEELMKVIERVGLDGDVLTFGLNAKLNGSEKDFAELVLSIRRHFLERIDHDISSLIEPFDEGSFISHQSLAVNLLFGFSLTEEPEEELLVKHPNIIRVLDNLGLLVPLAMMGRAIVESTLDIFNRDIQDDLFTGITPLLIEEFPVYKGFVEKDGDIRRLSRKEILLLLKLAFRYVPAFHPIISVPSSFMDYIVRCRSAFRNEIGEAFRGSLCFINPAQFCWKHTVFQNIIFGSVRSEISQAENIVREAVIKTIEEFGVRDRILLKGLNYYVGSQGGLLSGGQKQKICLARVLLKKPSILLLDEVTSGLDNRSQAKVQQLIREDLAGKCTIISVVHRLETVSDYDRILVMKAGRIVEAGSYDELVEKKGYFYDLLKGS